MAKLERLGCSKSLVGLVIPTGFTFNTDGTSLYMTMAALFVAQATNTHLTLTQQVTMLAVAVLTSKGASGVQGAAFIALVATLSVIPTIPVAGMALILGIDRFLSMFRATVNMIGNGVATVVLARWEGEVGQRNSEATISYVRDFRNTELGRQSIFPPPALRTVLSLSWTEKAGRSWIQGHGLCLPQSLYGLNQRILVRAIPVDHYDGPFAVGVKY